MAASANSHVRLDKVKTVLVLALDGVLDSSLAITLDTIRSGQAFLASAGRTGTLQLLVCGVTRHVHTGAGLRLSTDLTLRAALRTVPSPDWIVVPALGLVSEDEINSRLQRRDVLDAIAFLRKVPSTVPIATSCSSVFLLAATGLLSGAEVTTTWWLSHVFRSRHPDVRLDETRMLVRDDRYLTAGSAYSQLDLMLAIVGELLGSGIAHLCSRYLLIDRRPSQARYMMHVHTQHADPTVRAAERWIDAHLQDGFSVSDVAAVLAVSHRTLSRRIQAATGVSPSRFIQRRRLVHASHLIETTSMSIDEVAAMVGYQDGTALRKLIRREFGVTPAALRR